MLGALGVWSYTFNRTPFTYNPLYWGAVFPLGMYTVGTFYMARSMDMEFLDVIPQYFVYIALFAWLLAFVGLAKTLIGAIHPLISKRIGSDDQVSC